MMLEVGKPYMPIVGRPEGVFFDLDEAGYTLIYNFDKPTQAEISAVSSDQPFEIRYLVLNETIWVLSKCGSLNWTDAPFNPNLSLNYAAPLEPTLGKGTALTLIMTNAADGIVQHIRLIGLGTDFSTALRQEVIRLRNAKFNRASYDAGLSSVYAKYSTKALARMADHYFKVK